MSSRESSVCYVQYIISRESRLSFGLVLTCGFIGFVRKEEVRRAECVSVEISLCEPPPPPLFYISSPRL